MPSDFALAQLNAQNTGEVFLTLLQISSPEMEETLSFVNNFTDIESNGVTFTAWPFDLPFPEVGSDTLPSLTLTIDNIDERIYQALSLLSQPPVVTIMCVIASAPDTIEVGPLTLWIRSADVTMTTITATMVFEDMLNEPFPYETYTPGNAPGLF